MANKVFNMAGGRHSAAAYSAFEDALYGSCVATDSDFVATAGTGMTVQLTSGNGLISTGSGYARRIQADSTNTVTITAASATLPRTDSIVAYIDNAVTPTTSVTDNTNNILRFVAVAGTPASTPSAPSAVTIQSAVGAGNPYMVLWDVTIPAGATAMNTAVFTDQRRAAKVEISDGSITADKLASNAVTTPKIASNAVTGAKINFSSITSGNLASIVPEDLSSLVTPVSNNWSSRDDIKLYRYGNVFVLGFINWWVASISANSACNMGTINSSVLGSAAPIENAITIINGDDGKILNNGRIYINSTGAVSGYCATARSGATCMRGQITWIYKA